MTTFFVLANKGKWTKLNIGRVVLDYLVGIALALTALNVTTPEDREFFSLSPWVLPTLCLAFFAVLVINHSRHRPSWLIRRQEVSPADRNGGLDPTAKAS